LKAVTNTTPLIYLAKTNLLKVLKQLFEEVYISKEVYKEAVIQGIEGGYKDAHSIKKACKEWIKPEETKSDLSLLLSRKIPKGRLKEIIPLLSSLSDEDISAIVLAIELKVERLILDDRAALNVAKVIAKYYKFEVIGTGDVIIEGLSN
jgi:predicted nucleic acid-binding protein